VQTRFVDSVGSPIEGVELLLTDERATERSASERSGIDGTVVLALDFAFAGAPRTFTLEARRAGFALARRSIQAAPDRELLLGDWVLVAGGSVEGTVVDEHDVGLARVQVATLAEGVLDRDWDRRQRYAIESLARPGARGITDGNGAFRLDDVPAGRIRLVAVSGTRPAAISEPITVPMGGLATDVEIQMAADDGGTTITGVVLDPKGHAVPGAPISMRSVDSEYRITSGADGRFEVRCESKAPRDLTALDPGLRFREATVTDVQPGTKDLVLRLSTGPRITLTVHARDGRTIERFAVVVTAAARTQALATFSEADRAGGVLELVAPSEEFFVEVRANGWRPVRLGPLPAVDPPARLEGVLDSADGIRGRVTADGQPVSGARVALHAAVTENDTYNGFPLRIQPWPESDTDTDEEGRFSLSVESAGVYSLLVEADGYGLAEESDLALDPDHAREVEIALDHGGTLAVRVRSLERASVAGRLVALSRGDGRARTVRTDEAGEVELAGLTPGPWQVELSEHEIDPRQGAQNSGLDPAGAIPSNCRVVAGQVTPLELWLEGPAGPPCRLDVRLTIDGKPAEGWIAALDREGVVVLDGEAPAEPGLFRLALAQAGRYRLRLSPDSGDPAAMLVVLDTVELVELDELLDGERSWSLALETGALEGTLGSRPRGSLVFYRWQRGSIEALAPIAPGPDGRFRCARVPAGRGAIVRFDEGRTFEEQTPVVLRELEIEHGKTTSVEL
jgi:hypothetical protein